MYVQIYCSTVSYCLDYQLVVAHTELEALSEPSDNWRIISSGRNRGMLPSMFRYGDFVDIS